MTLDFYQLKEQPFAASPDPRFFYLSDTHRQALASLLRALQADRGFVTLLAQPGLGKTTLLSHILRSFGDKVSTIYIFQAVQAPVDLLRAMLADLGVREINENSEGMLSQLKALLNEEHRLGKRVVVVIDEAQNLDTSVFKVLRMLSNLETPRGRLIQFILCGRPMPSERLAAIKPLQWMQGGEPVAHLEPFNAQDTAQYLDHRLRTAGYDRQLPLFTPEAARLVAAYSHGTPRIINTLCSEALSAAHRHRREQIGADTVREAASTLNLTQLKPENMYSRPPQIITMPPISNRGVPHPPTPSSNADYVTVLPPQKAPPPPAEAAKTVVVAATIGQPAAPATLHAWTFGKESEPRVAISFAPNVAEDLLARPAEAIPDPLWQSASPEVVATREVEVVDAPAMDLAPSALAATEMAPAAAQPQTFNEKADVSVYASPLAPPEQSASFLAATGDLEELEVVATKEAAVMDEPINDPVSSMPASAELAPASAQPQNSAADAVVPVYASSFAPPEPTAPFITATSDLEQRPEVVAAREVKVIDEPSPLKGDPVESDSLKSAVASTLLAADVAPAASQQRPSAEDAGVPVHGSSLAPPELLAPFLLTISDLEEQPEAVVSKEVEVGDEPAESVVASAPALTELAPASLPHTFAVEADILVDSPTLAPPATFIAAASELEEQPEAVATQEAEVIDGPAIDPLASVVAAPPALIEVAPAASQPHLSATQAVVPVQAPLVVPPAPLTAANRRMKKWPKKTVPSKLKPPASPEVVAASSVVDAPIEGSANNGDPAKDVVPEKNVDLPKNVALFAMASKEVARAASRPETSAEETAVPVQGPPFALREQLEGMTCGNVIPLRGSQPAVTKSPTRKNGTALWSLVPRPAPGLAAAAVLLVFLTGVIFGMYHPRTSPPRVAEAPVLHESEPTVQRIQTPALIAVEPKATPSATSQDIEPAVEKSSPAHDLKGMDLESALQALSTKTQRQPQDQAQQSR